MTCSQFRDYNKYISSRKTCLLWNVTILSGGGSSKSPKWLYVTSQKCLLDKLIDCWRCCKNVFIPQDFIFLSLAEIIPTVNNRFGLVCTLLTSFYRRIFSLELVSRYIIQLHQQNFEFGLVYVPCFHHFIYEFSALSWCNVRSLNWILIGGCINLLHELQSCF